MGELLGPTLQLLAELQSTLKQYEALLQDLVGLKTATDEQVVAVQLLHAVIIENL